MHTSEASALPAWTAAGASVEGAQHARLGLPNQDCLGMSDCAAPGGGTLLAVADGHGSACSFRSGRGSQLAVAVALETLEAFLAAHRAARPGPLADADLPSLGATFCERWLEAVHADLAEHPFDDGERARLKAACQDSPHPAHLAYGSTLLAVAATGEQLLILQLGDGEILLLPPGGDVAILPLPADADQFGNVTDSLCLPGAARRFRTRVWSLREHPAELVIATTDGYPNSFETSAGFARVGMDLRAILRDAGVEAVQDGLPRWLAHASREGSGDDCTLGLLWNRTATAPPDIDIDIDEGGRHA